MKLCVLLPALNEGAQIGQLIHTIRNLPLNELEVTVLVVDDGSTDRTAAVAREAGAQVVSHPVNRGVGAAFRTGVEWARANGADFFLHMDSDGQIPADQIPLILEPVRRGEADLAMGSRFLGDTPEGLSSWKKFCLKSLSLTVGILTGYRLTDISCGFRCFNRRVLETQNPHFDYDYIQESLLQALAVRGRVKEVPIRVLYPNTPGKSAMSKKVVRYISRSLMMTGTSLVNFYRTRLRLTISQ